MEMMLFTWGILYFLLVSSLNGDSNWVNIWFIIEYTNRFEFLRIQQIACTQRVKYKYKYTNMCGFYWARNIYILLKADPVPTNQSASQSANHYFDMIFFLRHLTDTFRIIKIWALHRYTVKSASSQSERKSIQNGNDKKTNISLTFYICLTSQIFICQ